MWSLIDVFIPQLVPTDTAFVVWLVACLLSALVARMRGYPVVPFVLIGVLLGWPAVILALVATSGAYRPPSPAGRVRLGLASVWARDPLLQSRVDLAEVGDVVRQDYPELEPIYSSARAQGRSLAFVGRLGDYLNIRTRLSGGLFVHLSIAAFVSIGVKLISLKTRWLSVSDVSQEAYWTELAQWVPVGRSLVVDGLVPSLAFLGLRRSRIGFLERYRRSQYRAHFLAFWGLLVAGGTDRWEAGQTLCSWGYPGDVPVAALEELPTDQAAEDVAFAEAERVGCEARARLNLLHGQMVVLWCANGLVFAKVWEVIHGWEPFACYLH